MSYELKRQRDGKRGMCYLRYIPCSSWTSNRVHHSTLHIFASVNSFITMPIPASQRKPFQVKVTAQLSPQKSPLPFQHNSFIFKNLLKYTYFGSAEQHLKLTFVVSTKTIHLTIQPYSFFLLYYIYLIIAYILVCRWNFCMSLYLLPLKQEYSLPLLAKTFFSRKCGKRPGAVFALVLWRALV